MTVNLLGDLIVRGGVWAMGKGHCVRCVCVGNLLSTSKQELRGGDTCPCLGSPCT